MDFLTPLNQTLTDSRTHMDYLMRETGGRLPEIVRDADKATRRHFLTLALTDPQVPSQRAYELVGTLNSAGDARATLNTLSDWLTTHGKDNSETLPVVLVSILEMTSIPDEERFNLVEPYLKPNSDLNSSEAQRIIDMAVRHLGTNPDMALVLLADYNAQADAQNNSDRGTVYRGYSNVYESLIQYATSDQVVLDTMDSAIARTANMPSHGYNGGISRLFSALTMSAVFSKNLTIECFNKIGWSSEGVWSLFESAVSVNPTGRYGTEQALDAYTRQRIAVEISNYTIDPSADVPATGRTPALITILKANAYTRNLDDLLLAAVTEGNKTKSNDYSARYARGNYTHLRRAIVDASIWHMYPLLYGLSQSTDQDEKNLRSSIIGRLDSFPGENPNFTPTSDETVALWDMLANGKQVTATPDAQEAIIKSGLLPKATIEALATRKGRIGVTAKNQLGIVIETKPDATPATKAWDADFNADTRFNEYHTAAVAAGLTGIGALGSYIADTRMEMEHRTQARQLLISMLNHTPDYAADVPESTWVSLGRLREPLGMNNALLMKMQTLSPTAQKLASKNLVKTALL